MENVSRRSFMKLAGGAMAAMGFAACTGGNKSSGSASGSASQGSKSTELIIHGFEGSWTENARVAWYQPFEDKYGIKIVDNTQPYSAAKLKAMVDSNTVAWDLHTPDDVSDAKFTANQNLLEKIDFSVVKVPDQMIDAKDVVSDFWVAFDVESVTLVNRTDKWPDGGAPQSWADFWDVKQFPGPRALQNWAVTFPEKALLADGVAPDELYPLDLDRAFRVLDVIKPDIKVWWPIAEQALSQQLLASAEVYSLDMWNGRANQVVQAGIPGSLVWNQGFFFTPPFAIPKGAPNYDNANLFLNFVLEPEQQAAWSNLSYYGYVNQAAAPLVKESIQPLLPSAPENYALQVQVDVDWWAANRAQADERVSSFLAG